MKVIFIYPSIDHSYPLQIGALSAFVKKKGHQIKLIIFKTRGSNDISSGAYKEISEKIKIFHPDFVAFSCYEMSFPIIKKIGAYIKNKWPCINILVGGYYPTLAPSDVISFHAIDIICLGEGEKALAKLLSSWSSAEKNYKIKNLWFKKDGKIIKNPVATLLEDLSELPFPDRKMMDYQSLLDLEPIGERTVNVMATRGCPFQCSYCSNKYFRSIYPNKHKYFRFRSPENVIAEIKSLKRKYKFEKIGFHDDNLALDISWLKTFTKLYKNEINMPFYCATRVESCTDEILDELKKAACYLLLIGVESGDEKYRKKIMKRYMTNHQIITAFRRARGKGLLTWSFTMVALPFENRAMIFKTLWLNWQCHPDFVMASIFYPLKGTELGDICYKNGWVNLKIKERVSSYAWESILNHPVLSKTEIKIAKYLNSLVAIKSMFFWKILRRRLINFVIYKQRI